MSSWDFTNLIEARDALDPLWQSALLKGRCWGRKDGTNPFACSNITLATETKGRIELVSVSQTEDGKLKIHEFYKTKGTDLGFKTREALVRAGLKIQEKSVRHVKIFVGSNRGIYGSFPVYRAVLWILRDRSDELVPLEEIVTNESLIRSCSGIGIFMGRTPPDKRKAVKVVKRAMAYLRGKGHEIACVKDDLGRLCYCCAEAPTAYDEEMTVEATVAD
jgi:hypothetical protein